MLNRLKKYSIMYVLLITHTMWGNPFQMALQSALENPQETRQAGLAVAFGCGQYMGRKMFSGDGNSCWEWLKSGVTLGVLSLSMATCIVPAVVETSMSCPLQDPSCLEEMGQKMRNDLLRSCTVFFISLIQGATTELIRYG